MKTFTVGIIADDLTGANDTALQFHIMGADTQIILNPDENLQPSSNTSAWAIPTETRNIAPESAYEKVKEVTTFMKEKLCVDYFYKKIDSTLRGNIAAETVGMLQVLEYDAAIIMPAFPNEGRVTVGGYHLLKGIPIEKTEMASDPHSPIYESHIPTILKKQMGSDYEHLVGSIELKTVLKGAGPILSELNSLIKSGKKLISVDAVSITDMEQVMLALGKSEFDILPCGSAGAAQVMSKLLFQSESVDKVETSVSNLPTLVVAGSATQLCANQVQKLIESGEIENTYSVSLNPEDIISYRVDELVSRVENNLVQDNVVVIHASDIVQDEKLQEYLIENELTKKEFATKIVDVLAAVTQKISTDKEFILVTVGGETSFECCRRLNSEILNIKDAAAPAIPLCIDNNSRVIITKSGNLGTINTLVEILKYIERHK